MQKKRSSCSDSRLAVARLALALAAASSLAPTGCGATCKNSPEDNPPELYTGGSGDPASATYESSPPTSGILPFPGGKQYLLAHHLGFTPTYPDISVGFNADGEGLSTCAGNTCIVRCVNSEIIWIQNDTCADFFVRVQTTKKSAFQQGTLCPGGNSVPIPGTPDTADASAEASDTPEAQSPTDSPTDTPSEAPAE